MFLVILKVQHVLFKIMDVILDLGRLEIGIGFRKLYAGWSGISRVAVDRVTG